jgi:hypothetical protein
MNEQIMLESFPEKEYRVLLYKRMKRKRRNLLRQSVM